MVKKEIQPTITPRDKSTMRHALRNPAMSGPDCKDMVSATIGIDPEPENIPSDLAISQVQIPTVETKSIYSPTILERNVEDTTKGYYVLREDIDKFFRTLESLRQNPFLTAKEIAHLQPNDRSNVTANLQDIKLLLDIESFTEVPRILKESTEDRAERIDKANKKLAAQYGITDQSASAINDTVSRYGTMANTVIQTLLDKELSEVSSALETSNDVESCNDPVELILMTFDDEYAPQVRFEAKRKLELMKLIAKVESREKRYSYIDQQQDLDTFLTEHVFTQETGKGQKGRLTSDYLLSTFDEKTGECTEVKVLSMNEFDVDVKNRTYRMKQTEEHHPTEVNSNGYTPNETFDILPDQKLKRIQRRAFTYNGRKIPIYIQNPLKEVEKKVLKTIRRGVDDPNTAIDDDVRMMCVFDKAEDARIFITHMQKCANEAGSRIEIGQIENTLNGEERSVKAGGLKNGGSKKIHWMKFDMSFAQPGKMPLNAEVQFFTNKTWMNYLYEPGVAHEEFAVSRFFGKDDERGAADLLFPYKFYDVDMKIAREEKLLLVREELRRQGS